MGAAKAWFSLGRLHDQDGDHAEAILAYRESIRLRPDDPVAWYNLGVLCREYGEAGEAVKAFLEAIGQKPHDTDSWYGLGMTYALLGERNGMLEVYQQLAIVDPAAAEEFAADCMGSVGSKSPPDSAPEWTDLAPRAPGKPGDLPSPADAWYGLALMYRKQGQEAEALGAFREAVRFDPDHARAWYGLGTSCRKQKDDKEALRAFQQVIRLKPDVPEIWQNVGAIHQDHDEHGKAAIAFREAVRLKPTSVAGWYGLGISLASLSDADGVHDAQRHLEELDPSAAREFSQSLSPSASRATAGGTSTSPALVQEAAVEGLSGPPPDPSASFKTWLDSLPPLEGGLPGIQRRRKLRGRAARRP